MDAAGRRGWLERAGVTEQDADRTVAVVGRQQIRFTVAVDVRDRQGARGGADGEGLRGPEGAASVARQDADAAVAAAWQGYEGQVLALRPDRYVMGAFPASDSGPAALAIENLLHATWSDRVESASLSKSDDSDRASQTQAG